MTQHPAPASAPVPTPAPVQEPGEHARLQDLLPVPVARFERQLESTVFKAYVFVTSMSIRYKIAGALVLVLCLAITSLGVVSFSQQKRVLLQETQKRGEALARHIASVGKTGLLTDDELSVLSTIREVQKTPGVLYAMVLDNKGRVFSHSSIDKKGATLAGPEDKAALDSRGLLFQQCGYEGEPIVDASVPIVSKFGGKDLRVGTARIGLSQKALVAAIRRQKASFFWITSAFVLLGLVIAFALGNVLTRQIVILATAMKVVAKGDLNHMVPVHSHDDIGRLADTFNDMILKLREKLHMERYLSESTLQLIHRLRDTEKLKLGGERRYVTALFSDVRGFTAMTETLPAEEVVGLLNIYLNLQAEVVHQWDGTVDKFVGDEVMAIFTGTECEARAARAAREIQNLVASLNDSRSKAGKRQIQLGIGLNAGDVIMGNMGSERRMDYTVIGDPVNVAARLCGAAKPGQIIMSQSVRQALGAGCQCEALPELTVKGKKDPLHVYSLAGVKDALRARMRKPVNLSASYSLAGLAEEVHAAVVHNISESGCVIEGDQAFGIGTQLELTVNLPALNLMGRTRSLVRHLRKHGGRYFSGLVFEGMTEAARLQLSDWIHAVSVEKAGPPSKKFGEAVSPGV